MVALWWSLRAESHPADLQRCQPVVEADRKLKNPAQAQPQRGANPSPNARAADLGVKIACF